MVQSKERKKEEDDDHDDDEEDSEGMVQETQYLKI